MFNPPAGSRSSAQRSSTISLNDPRTGLVIASLSSLSAHEIHLCTSFGEILSYLYDGGYRGSPGGTVSG
jgi:hypothetical protein